MDARTQSFEIFKTAILKPVVNNNRFIPRVKILKTTMPDKVLSYTETFKHISNELNKQN